jgi:hypothetical protein
MTFDPKQILAGGLAAMEADFSQKLAAVYAAAEEKDAPGVAKQLRAMGRDLWQISKSELLVLKATILKQFGRNFPIRDLEEMIAECLAQAGAEIGHGPELNRNGAAPLPRICTTSRQLRDISAEALAALQRSNDPLFLFVRGGQMVSVVKDEKQRQVISGVTEAALRGWLSRSANYFRVTPTGGDVECAPPLEVVRDILSLPPAEWGFQPLDAVVEAPILRSDGSILTTPGYDPATALYYAPDPDLQVPMIADKPTAADIDAALELIGLALGDFPFADLEREEDCPSRANAIAAMLTPIIKPAINAPAPLALIDAPQAGTGKSLMADVISIIATGRPGEMFSAPRDDDEWRKQITTALLSGSMVVIIDNVTRRLDSADLAKVLTETSHADRAMRTHTKLSLPVKAVFFATGNNLQVGGDMPRRCYWVRLDAKTSRPFERTGFQIEDLKDWAKINRGKLLAALLTLARAWYAAGRPAPRTPRLGSYEAWCTTVGGILQYAGINGFLGNAAELYAEADVESIQWEAFLELLDEVFYGDPFTVAEIVSKLNATSWNGDTKRLEPTEQAMRIRAALPDYLADAVDRNGSFQRRAGKCFAERVGRRFGDSQIHLKRDQVLHKVQSWKIAKKTGGSDFASKSCFAK